MLNIDKVRRVVKAKYGLTAPILPSFKPFENPKGFELTMYNNLALFLSKIDWEPSYYNLGTQIPTPKIDATDMLVPNNLVDWTPTLDYLYKTNNTPEAPVSSIEFKSPENYPEYLKAAALFKVDSKAFMLDLKGHKFTYNPDFQRKTMFDKNIFLRAVEGIKNFSLDNPYLANIGFNMGLNYLNSQFDKGVYRNKGTLTVLGITGTLSNLHPALKVFDTAARATDKLFGKLSDSYHVDKELEAKMGGSYTGSYKYMHDVEDKLNKFYGFWSTGSRQNANKHGLVAREIGANIEDIADTANDLRAMVNDINRKKYEIQVNGGYPIALNVKQGGTLTQKINLVKSRKFNQVINVNTKLIEEFKDGGKLEVSEWEPIIDDIELYKDGGSLPELWEPIIDDISDYWEPIIDDIEVYKEGGSIKEELETPEIEETNQKNLIPEGALHKNKHHMEHTEGLTLKGIPVIDNEGEQLAEIELDEIIFTLEVTKKLEELYKEGTDEAAIEAGKLLVKEILFNTDDRTDLIAKCEKGGKL